MDSLSIEAEREGDTPVIRLRGELDRLTADALDATVRELASRGAPTLILDVREVEFIDSAGLRSLSRAHNLMFDDERELIVRAPSPAIRRLIELVGLHEVLTIR